MFILLFIATLLILVFCWLFLTAGKPLGTLLKNCMIENAEDGIKSMQIELSQLAEKVKASQGVNASLKREPDPKLVKRAKKLKKQIEAQKKLINGYKKKGLGMLDLVPLAGYRVIQLLRIDSSNSFVSGLNSKCVQFKETNEAMNHTIYITASLIGNILLGVCMFFLGSGLGLALGLGTRALVLGLVLMVVLALLGYLPYDNVNRKINQRADAIERDFPRAVSKLTLLAVSGMDVSQAWNLVASTEVGTLYEEMERVVIDMQNNVSPVNAFTKFIKRCNYVYTTKLATAVMQNTIRGNSAIVELLRELNSECWMEYKHTARRKGEAISSKLLVPTLLLFAGILILVMVPAVNGFNF